jgi:hypothetical protein
MSGMPGLGLDNQKIIVHAQCSFVGSKKLICAFSIQGDSIPNSRVPSSTSGIHTQVQGSFTNSRVYFPNSMVPFLTSGFHAQHQDAI